MYSSDTAVPTCISCSQGGMLVVIGFTDDKLKLFDMRMKGDDFHIDLDGGHSNTVKGVKISPDGMTCYSIGADNTLRVWDISQRKCLKVY